MGSTSPTAAAKVSTTVKAYEDADRTLVLDVTSNFAAAEYITLAGAQFTGFSAVSATDNLELDGEGNLWVAAPLTNKVVLVNTTTGHRRILFQALTLAQEEVVAEVMHRIENGEPCLELLTEGHAYIVMRYLLRDDNLEIMDRYLTDGKRSIPMVVSFAPEGRELFRWGPRPAPAQAIIDAVESVARARAEGGAA